MQKYKTLYVQRYNSTPFDDITCFGQYTVVKGFRNKEYYYKKCKWWEVMCINVQYERLHT
jgi:hypothetical protein